jgi:4a-hydroxytetrahydrobiopterin dehydratase
MTDLLTQKCRALEGSAAMDETTVHAHLAQVPGWQRRDGAIEKTFAFKDYYETIAFVNALAWICNAEDHHPDLSVGFSRCVVRFNTHSVGGITLNDFICAAKANALVSHLG